MVFLGLRFRGLAHFSRCHGGSSQHPRYSCRHDRLAVNQLRQNRLLAAALDVVHHLDPLHLVLGFEVLRHAQRLLHLLDELLHHAVRLPVDLLQMAV